MKQTIEIEVPDGKKAVWKDDKIVFEDIKPQLPKTWEEFCNNYKVQNGECYIASNSIIQPVPSKIRITYRDNNLLPNERAAEQHLALMQLHQLRDCYRQGWVPDYMDNSKKFYIINFKNKLCIECIFNYKVFLSFQTREIAEEFLNNFRGLIEQAGDLI